MPDKLDTTLYAETEAGALPDSQVQPEILRYKPPARLKLVGIVAAGAAVFIVVFGLIGRVFAAHEVTDWTREAAVPVVKLVKPSGSGEQRSLTLPGAVQAFNNAPIYAQVSGYVQKWFVDIGTPVKAGNLLAQIDPRTYQAAFDQAKGQLARDTANLENARVDLGRYKQLAAQNAISSQQLSTQQATVNADTGVVEADRAALESARINLGYTRIVAPFDGIVTSRSVDIGNFVAVGNVSATPLYTVADEGRLRIYVRVPQSYSSEVRPGMTATFAVPEFPGKTFAAKVDSTSNAVDTGTGTVLVQLQADNSGHVLKPGDYAQVHFDLHANAIALQVPSSALMFLDRGTAVATLARGGRVTIKPVTIAQDLGTSVEIATGLSTSDRVIDNPPDSLRPGDVVRVAQTAMDMHASRR